MKTVYLIRHGSTDDNINGIFQGNRDVPLNKQGILQAEFLEKRFQNIDVDVVYSSPLKRASYTASKIAGAHGLQTIYLDGLIELNGGNLQGYSSAENRKRYPLEMYNLSNDPIHFCAPGGESSKEVYDRMILTMNEIISS